MTPSSPQNPPPPSPLAAVLAIALKDARLLLRDRSALFFTLAFPVLFGLGFGFIFQRTFQSTPGSFSINIAIIDQDQTDPSANLIAALERSESLEIQYPTDPDAARDAVRRGNIAALILIEEGFGESIENVLSGDSVTISGAVDPSRFAAAATVNGLLQAAAFETIAATFMDPTTATRLLESARADFTNPESANAIQNPLERAVLGQALNSAERFLTMIAPNDNQADNQAEDGTGTAQSDPPSTPAFNPVTIDLESIARQQRGIGGINNAFELTFPQAVCWGLLGCVTGFGLALSRERTGGTIHRLTAAPIPAWVIPTAKALGCFAGGMIVLTALWLAFLPLGVRLASPVALLAAFAAASFGFTGLMALLGTVSRSEAGTEGGARAVLLILALGGGAGVPLEFFSGWLQYVTMFSPFRWAIRAVEGATYRAYTPAEMAIPCGVLIAFGLACLAISLLRFRSWSRAANA